MKRVRSLVAPSLALLLILCLYLWNATRENGAKPATTRPTAANAPVAVDSKLYQTARQVAPLAVTAEEQELVRQALRMADHELDQAFSNALQVAAAGAPPTTGAWKELAARIAESKARVAAGEQRVALLTKKAAEDAQVELAKAQLTLDREELEEARQDLARQGGDEQARLSRALQEHETVHHEPLTMAAPTRPATPGTLLQQVQSWMALGETLRQVDTARQHAATKAGALAHDHGVLKDRLEHGTTAPQQAAAQPAESTDETSAEDSDEAEPAEDTGALIARLHQLSDQRKSLGLLALRIQDDQQLAEVYRNWEALVEGRRRSVLHVLLQSLAALLAVALAVVLVVGAIHRAFDRQADRRKLHQLRAMASLAAEIVGALVALLIVFGPPSQTPTIIGLATAGLTVVLKDFIVAFIGWFVLMGKNGLRVGDWVEINGVGGEVIEIGMLRTVLLEMGNWTNTGHPTGRRVAFVNGFAIEGHFFNFSTAGQWLWDELQMVLPMGSDPYRMAQRIREVVEKETESEARLAEQDWLRVTEQYGVRGISAAPAADLRPSVNGLEVVVRYITRAPLRYQVKSRLLEAIVTLLHGEPSAESVAAAASAELARVSAAAKKA